MSVAAGADESKLDPAPRRDEFEAAREKYEASAEGGESGRLQYENGFTWKVFFGTLFVAFIMLPGAIYMGLVTGASLGPAAQWVTIVLFTEIARRSFLPLKRQEIYCIWYMAGSVTVTLTGFTLLPGISGGAFGQLFTYAYLIQSPQLASVAGSLPSWVAPHLGSHAYNQRTFIDPAWLVPIGVLLIGQLCERFTWMGLGFMIFKLVSDVERLPFPMAPVAASGASALAEANTKDDSWRWGVFSTGAMVGLVFGIFYMAIPILSNGNLVFLQIPFFDLTPNTERIMTTALTGYNPDLSLVITGFVLPWNTVLGMFCGSVLFQIIINPVLYHMHLFRDFVPGSGAIQAQISLNLDFWMSFGIGIQLAIAAIGIVTLIRLIFVNRAAKSAPVRGALARNVARGDFPWPAAAGAWIVGVIGYVSLVHHLVPLFPLELLLFYGLVFTPINSYISARMFGLTGQSLAFPYLNQVVVAKSGYSQPDVWFSPMPLSDYGWSAQRFREVELTGTTFTSIVKLEVLMFLVVPIASFLYWGFLWHTSNIPSTQFPFAQKMWPIQATSISIWTQINNKSGAAWALHAIKPNLIASGFGVGIALYAVMMALKLPLMFFYGFMSGATQFPHNVLPMFVGSLLSRFYFAKRFGADRWSMYAPVLLAGYFCGIGLIGMGAIAIALIGKTINFLPF